MFYLCKHTFHNTYLNTWVRWKELIMTNKPPSGPLSAQWDLNRVLNSSVVLSGDNPSDLHQCLQAPLIFGRLAVRVWMRPLFPRMQCQAGEVPGHFVGASQLAESFRRQSDQAFLSGGWAFLQRLTAFSAWCNTGWHEQLEFSEFNTGVALLSEKQIGHWLKPPETHCKLHPSPVPIDFSSKTLFDHGFIFKSYATVFSKTPFVFFEPCIKVILPQPTWLTQPDFFVGPWWKRLNRTADFWCPRRTVTACIKNELSRHLELQQSNDPLMKAPAREISLVFFCP